MTDTKVAGWHAGWNQPGYLPESDVEHFDNYADAVAYIADELRSRADTVATWTEAPGHDERACPYWQSDPDFHGDDCPIGQAEALTLEADELSAGADEAAATVLGGVPIDGVNLGDGYVGFIAPCDEPECQDESEEG